MSSLNLDSFPNIPSYTGVWFPVYMEPVIGCGERITVAVTAKGTDNNSSVVQSIRPEVLECIYGPKYKDLQSQIEWVIDSLSNFMKKNNDSSEWIPPFGGIHVGKEKPAASESIEGILKQAILFSASLGALSMATDEDNEDSSQTRDNFYRDIKNRVVSIKPELKSNFGRKVSLSDADLKTVFGYLTHDYAANFGTIHASRTHNDRIAKSKAFDLESLRLRQGLFNVERCELILGVPAGLQEDVTIESATKERFLERIGNLTYLASKQEVEVIVVDSVISAAEHVLAVAA